MIGTRKKSIGSWMWATPVLIASLIFWPIWLVLLIGGLALLIGVAITGIAQWLSKALVSPQRGAEIAVAWIERHKFTMLASSVGVALVLASIAIFLACVEHLGEQLNSLVVDLGGYVAIAALVLGLPALCYAMVTDSAVGRIEDQLGMGKEKIKDIETVGGSTRMRRRQSRAPLGWAENIFQGLGQCSSRPGSDSQRSSSRNTRI